MNNTDTIRQIRYIFDFSDSKMMELFALAGHEVTRAEVCDWLKKEDDPENQPIYDKQLAYFLNGFIIDKRGKREGPPPKAEKTLSNNLVLRKLKIALNLKDHDIIDVFGLVHMIISKHELSALFRNPKQSQFRLCKDQFLRNFLHGLQIKHRGSEEE